MEPSRAPKLLPMLTSHMGLQTMQYLENSITVVKYRVFLRVRGPFFEVCFKLCVAQQTSLGFTVNSEAHRKIQEPAMNLRPPLFC